MIHQFIFAAPKPGWSSQEFLRYWRYEHAVKYACRIPQIHQYLIDARVDPADQIGGPFPHQGIAEIWLENDEEQLASLQTPEFLQGARADEPNWAAFWMTIGVDTDPHVLLAGPDLASDDPSWVKVTTLLKRAPGTTVPDFRSAMLDRLGPAAAALPGLRRHLVGHTSDGAYTFGEAPFDAVAQWWFDDLPAARAALASAAFGDGVGPVLERIADPAHLFSMTCTESWVLRPAVGAPAA